MFLKLLKIILILALVESQGIASQNYFTVLKNQDINMTVGESSLISSVYKPSWMQCMTVCYVNPNCKTAVHDNSKGRLTNCFTYSRYFQAIELIPSITGVICEKKTSSASKTFFLTMKHMHYFIASCLTPLVCIQ